MKKFSKLPKEEQTLRKLLWLNHNTDHFPILYGDDGEMQCSTCEIDFCRMTAQEIEDKIIYNSMKKYIDNSKPTEKDDHASTQM